MRSDPLPEQAKLQAYYELEYRLAYKGTEQPRPHHVYRAAKIARERMEWIARAGAGSRALDAGCGGGELLFLLRAAGYDAEGLEPNEGYANHARLNLGLPIMSGCLETAELPAESYDLICCFHVLEHVREPVCFLGRLAKAAKPDSWLFLEVPNLEAPFPHPARRFHPAHLFNFSARTLTLCAIAAGWVVAEIGTTPDGGNLRLAARPGREASCRGNSEAGLEALQRWEEVSKLRRYYRSGRVWTRAMRRLVAQARERWQARKQVSSTSILENFARQDPKRPPIRRSA